jgi:hypothetical protein
VDFSELLQEIKNIGAPSCASKKRAPHLRSRLDFLNEILSGRMILTVSFVECLPFSQLSKAQFS